MKNKLYNKIGVSYEPKKRKICGFIFLPNCENVDVKLYEFLANSSIDDFISEI